MTASEDPQAQIRDLKRRLSREIRELHGYYAARLAELQPDDPDFPEITKLVEDLGGMRMRVTEMLHPDSGGGDDGGEPP